MKLWLLGLGLVLFAPPVERGILEPRVHLLHGAVGGDPMLVYYESKTPLELRTLNIPGVPIRSWRFMTAYGKRSLEIELVSKPGLNVEWDKLNVTDLSGKARVLGVAPSRAIVVQERDRYELSYERLEQEPSARLYLGLRIFNDANETITVDKFIYAPGQVSANRILLEPRYDPKWFTKLETWGKSKDDTPPDGATLADSSQLNLKIPLSKGFSAAIVGSSFKPAFSCARAGVKRDPSKRVDSAYLQPLIQYRVGNGAPQFYPVPDAIIADLCP
jgi:hypothetical protein